MNTLKWTRKDKKNPFLIDRLTETLHENLYIRAFWGEDESNQQFLRLYEIERVSIFGQL